jgi:hypothetical protein
MSAALDIADIHPRAAEMLVLVNDGLTLKAVAGRLGVQPRTVYATCAKLRDIGALPFRELSPETSARAPATPSIERCLVCDRKFRSFDRRLNRVCGACK